MTGGAEGIRTPDPHTASVMRYHCATAPMLSARHVDNGRDPGEGYFIVRPRGSRASSAFPVDRLAPSAGSLTLGIRVLLPFAAFRLKV